MRFVRFWQAFAYPLGQTHNKYTDRFIHPVSDTAPQSWVWWIKWVAWGMHGPLLKINPFSLERRVSYRAKEWEISLKGKEITWYVAFYLLSCNLRTKEILEKTGSQKYGKHFNRNLFMLMVKEIRKGESFKGRQRFCWNLIFQKFSTIPMQGENPSWDNYFRENSRG